MRARNRLDSAVMADRIYRQLSIEEKTPADVEQELADATDSPVEENHVTPTDSSSILSAVSASSSGAISSSAKNSIKERRRRIAETKSQRNKVQVVVRIRPPLPRELSGGTFNSCLGCVGDRVYVTTVDQPVVVTREGCESADVHHFDFHKVFDKSATTMDVYRTSCSTALDAVVSGVNATIFAYGQTGTGKTYTMMGDGGHPGVSGICVQRLLDMSEGEDAVQLKASCVQIYNRHVTDLLSGAKPCRNLALRERAGEVEVDGVTFRAVHTLGQFRELHEEACSRRKQASTELNSSSSRSHMVLTLGVTAWAGEVATEAKLHLVDLAGSERVKESGVSGDQLTEARHINLSLFHLIRVVHALNADSSTKAVVPYKEDRLTYLLKDSLGGKSKTLVIAAISPAQRHCKETYGTLRFARSCSQVCNAKIDKTRHVSRKRPWKRRKSAPPKKVFTKEPTVLPWAGLAVGDKGAPGGRVSISTSMGRVSGLLCGDKKKCARGLAVCLHGYPSDAESRYRSWCLPMLHQLGYLAFAMDLPGCGHTTAPDCANKGRRLRTRSEYNLEEGGTVDVVCACIRGLQKTYEVTGKVVVVGYDWGAGVALSMAVSRRSNKLLSKVVCWHPSFNEVERDELLRVRTPTQIIWVKQDQFHSWTKWKSNAKKLKSALGPSYSQLVLTETEYAKRRSSRLTPAIDRAIALFLTGVDPLAPTTLQEGVRPANEVATTDGRVVVQRDNVVVPDQVAMLTNKLLRDKHRDAALAFVRCFASGRLYDMLEAMSGSGEAKREAMSLFSRLPELSPRTLTSPDHLVSLGVWDSECCANWEGMRRSPRYFRDRQVLVRCERVDALPSSPHFMHVVDKKHARATSLVTPLARLVSVKGSEAEVDVPSGEGITRITVSMKQVLQLNQAHVPPLTLGGKRLVLEDGIYCDYNSPLAKAKMFEIACALRPHTTHLDFNRKKECVSRQTTCIRTIRSCLDLTTFQRGADGQLTSDGEHTRDRTRYCGDDAAKFALHGQGHCHTVSSCMFAFLYPWQAVLGIDVRYRGGFSIHDPHEPVADSPERHQWLELSLRPSMLTVACDLYMQDGHKDRPPSLLTWPISEAYLEGMYPNGALKVFGGQPVKTSPLNDTDVCSSLHESPGSK